MALLSLSDTLGREGHWLLDLSIGGRVYRFADVDIEVLDHNGLSYSYVEGLEPLTSAPSELGADASITVKVTSGDDWAAIRARGHSLELRPAVLRRWFEGQVLENAAIILQGLTAEVAFGGVNEPLSLAVKRSLRSRARVLPSPQMVVDDVTWPDSAPYTRDDAIDGSYYPIIIGHPGRGGGFTKATSPALLVRVSTVAGDDDDWLLIAGHRVKATQVRIWDYTDKPTSSELMTVYHEVDGLGRTVAVVKPGAGTALTIAPGRQYYTGWKITPGGGMIDPSTGDTLRGAGSVIRHLLQAYTDIRLDTGRMAVEADILDNVKIDGWWNAPTRVDEWLKTNVLPLLPVTPIQGAQGLYYRRLNWNATPNDIKAYLSADIGHIERASSVKAMSFTPANQITIRYRQDRISGRYRTQSIISADGNVIDGDSGQSASVKDTRSSASYRCAISKARLQNEDGDTGIRSMELESPVLWDRASAVAVLQDLAAIHALTKMSIDYWASPEWEWLQEGTIVAVTDSEISIDEVTAIIVKRTIGGPRVKFLLVLLDEVASHKRLTG